MTAANARERATIDWSAPGFLGRAPDQTGYVVEDLEDSVRMWSEDLGLQGWAGYRYDASYVPRRLFRGAPQLESVTMNAIWGGGTIGLIQPVAGESLFSETLRARGPGIHHVSYFTGSVAAGRAWLASRGWEELMSGGGHGLDGDGEYAYFARPTGLGCYLQIIEKPARRAEPHFRFDAAGRMLPNGEERH